MTGDQRPPARRFIDEQSWWIASELVRRHPSRRVHHMHPGGGMYDVLRVYRHGAVGGMDVIDLNRNGRIHLHGVDRFEPIPWTDVLAADNPHDIVHRVEEGRGWPLETSAPATQKAGLTYRLLARLLLRRLEDRHPWTIAMGYVDSADAYEHERFDPSPFAGAAEATRILSDDGRDWLEWSRWWVVSRADEPVLALHDDALLYGRDGSTTDLMKIYGQRRDIDDVATEALAVATG